MSINSQDQLIASMATAPVMFVSKTTATATLVGVPKTLWSGVGIPQAGVTQATGSSATGTSPGNVSLTTGNWARCDSNNTLGSFRIPVATPTGQQFNYLSHLGGSTSGSAGILFIYDRVAHGFIGSLAAGTTNFTWTNNTTDYVGGGIFPFLEVVSSMTAGSVISTTLNYTSTSGSARTGQVVAHPYSGFASWAAGNFLPISTKNTGNVQDLGVGSVQSLTMSGTALAGGSANIVLAKLIATLPMSSVNVPAMLDPMLSSIDPLRSNPSLFGVLLTSAAATCTFTGYYKVITG